MADIDQDQKEYWYLKGQLDAQQSKQQAGAETLKRESQYHLEKDWMLKLETTHYRCGCVSEVHAICGHPGAAPHFHHSDRLCDNHAAERAKDGVMYGRT